VLQIVHDLCAVWVNKHSCTRTASHVHDEVKLKYHHGTIRVLIVRPKNSRL
jgi:hypothetical protein